MHLAISAYQNHFEASGAAFCTNRSTHQTTDLPFPVLSILPPTTAPAALAEMFENGIKPSSILI